MSDLYRNPEEQPAPEELESRRDDAMDWGGSRMNNNSPAGNTHLINGDEKGILEAGLFEVMAKHQQAALGSDHDKYARGIYADTQPRYAD